MIEPVDVTVPTPIRIWLRKIAGAWAMSKAPARSEQRSNFYARVEGNYFGLMCQWAAASWLGVPHGINVQRGGDDGIDFELEQGTVDVKWTKKNRPPIYLPMHEGEFLADIAILGITKRDTQDTMRLLGWVTRADFEVGSFRFDFGYGERLCYDYRKLAPMDELKVKQLAFGEGHDLR